jgi:sec-independent protein translocase protein TatA
MLGLGVPELLFILVIALLLFGAERLPKVARSMGQAVSEFKKGMQDPAREEAKADAANIEKKAKEG